MGRGTTIVDRLNKLSGKDATTIAKALENVEEAGVGGAADWNENDPEAKGYIANRPFYTGDAVSVSNLDLACSSLLRIKPTDPAAQHASLFLQDNEYHALGTPVLFDENMYKGYIENYNSTEARFGSTIHTYDHLYLRIGLNIGDLTVQKSIDNIATAKLLPVNDASLRAIIEYKAKYVRVILRFYDTTEEEYGDVKCKAEYIVDKDRVESLIQDPNQEINIGYAMLSGANNSSIDIPIPAKYIPDPIEKGAKRQHTILSNTKGFLSYYGDSPNTQSQGLQIYNGHLLVNNPFIRASLRKAVGALPDYSGCLISDRSLYSSPFFVYYYNGATVNPSNCFSAIPLAIATDVQNTSSLISLTLIAHKLGEPNYSSGVITYTVTNAKDRSIKVNVNAEEIYVNGLVGWDFYTSDKQRYALLQVNDAFNEKFSLYCGSSASVNRSVYFKKDTSTDTGSVLTYVLMNCINQSTSGSDGNVCVTLFDPYLVDAQSDVVI